LLQKRKGGRKIEKSSLKARRDRDKAEKNVRRERPEKGEELLKGHPAGEIRFSARAARGGSGQVNGAVSRKKCRMNLTSNVSVFDWEKVGASWEAHWLSL